MSKIPKLPKGQSRPASPEPSPNPINDNDTPKMQVLHPRSSSLTRSSSLRRSFIRPPKSSVTPPQKSGSPPPSAGKSPLAKGLPPSGLPHTGITPPRTGLQRKTSLPPSGLTPPVSVPKIDSPNTKMLSSSPSHSSKLASPRNSPLNSSFSRNSPLRSSRIPKKKSLPPDPSYERAESVTSEKADSISSEMADSISSNNSDDSRNSSPTPSNISKIPTVKGSTPSSVTDRINTLKNRRLKYPALWGLGAPNFFSEEKEMAGNTSLELLRLGVEELETRVSSLECQMGIQNTELLYNSDDEDKSQQDTNSRMHDASESNVTPSAVCKIKINLERENSNLSLSPLDIMYTYKPSFSLQDLQNVSKAYNWDMEDNLVICQERNHCSIDLLLGAKNESYDEKVITQGNNHFPEEFKLSAKDVPYDEKENQEVICHDSNHFTEDPLLGAKVEQYDEKESKVPCQEIKLSNYEYSDEESVSEDVSELKLDDLEDLSLPDETFNVTEEDISNACDWNMEDFEDIAEIQEEQCNENFDNGKDDKDECVIADADIPFGTIGTFDLFSNCENNYKINLGQINDQCINKSHRDLNTDELENKIKKKPFSISKSTTKFVNEKLDEIEFIETHEISKDNLDEKSTVYENIKPLVSVRSAITNPGEVIASTVAVTLLAIPDRIKNILLMLENKLGVRLIETILKKSNSQYDFVPS